MIVNDLVVVIQFKRPFQHVFLSVLGDISRSLIEIKKMLIRSRRKIPVTITRERASFIGKLSAME